VFTAQYELSPSINRLLSAFKGLTISKLVFHFTKVMRVEPLLRGSIRKDLSLMDSTWPTQTEIISIFRGFIVSVQTTNAEEARHTIINPADSMLNL
jgi:hypothetical protein